MIGYVLLIVFAVIMAGIVYQWAKTYVPKDLGSCDDGVSVFIEDIECNLNGTNYDLNITLRNSGRFSIAGYLIHGSNETGQEVATIELSGMLESGGEIFGSSIIFENGNDNTFSHDSTTTQVFRLNNPVNQIEIIPAQFKEENNRVKFVVCGDAKVEQKIDCE